MEPVDNLVLFLRDNIVDPNGARSGEWIFPYYPDISEVNEWPFISVEPTPESGDSMGFGTEDMWARVEFDIQIVTRRGVFVSNMENQYLVDTIGRQVVQKLRQYRKTDSNLSGFHNFTYTTFPIDYDEYRMLYKRVVTVRFDTINAGE